MSLFKECDFVNGQQKIAMEKIDNICTALYAENKVYITIDSDNRVISTNGKTDLFEMTEKEVAMTLSIKNFNNKSINQPQY